MLAQVETFEDAYSAAKGSHALCILTEWDEFKELDFRVLHPPQNPLATDLLLLPSRTRLCSLAAA